MQVNAWPNMAQIPQLGVQRAYDRVRQDLPLIQITNMGPSSFSPQLPQTSSTLDVVAGKL